MNRDKVNVVLACILEAASAPEGAPSGVMYAALMGVVDLHDYQALLTIAEGAGLVKVAKSHLVTITPKGAEMVEKIRAHKSACERNG